MKVRRGDLQKKGGGKKRERQAGFPVCLRPRLRCEGMNGAAHRSRQPVAPETRFVRLSGESHLQHRNSVPLSNNFDGRGVVPQFREA